MSPPLPVGLIGCGRAGTLHAGAVQRIRRTHIVGVHDEDASRARTLADAAGCRVLSLPDLLEAAQVLCVATPDWWHGRHLLAASRAGARAVLLESPPGRSRGEVEGMASAARRHGAAVVVSLPAALAMSRRQPPSRPTEITCHVPDEGSRPLQRCMRVADAVEGVFGRRAALLAATGDDDPPLAVELMHGDLLASATPALAALRAAHGPLTVLEVHIERREVTLRLSRLGGECRLRIHRSPRAVAALEVLDDDGAVATFDDADEAATVDRLAGVWLHLLGRADGDPGPSPLDIAAVADDLRCVEEAARLAAATTPVGGTRPGVVGFGAGVMSAVHLGLASTRGRVLRVASHTAFSAEGRALLLGAEPCEADSGAVLTGASVAVIAGPPRTHAAQALAAVAAGCAVLVEKPMTATVAEARRLHASAVRSGARALLAENWAYQPAVRAAVSWARRRQLRRVEVTAHWPLPAWLGLHDPEYGGGVLFDGGPHLLELARMLLGRPGARRVTARLEDRGTRVDMAAAVEIEFEGGATAAIAADLCSTVSSVTAVAPGFVLDLEPRPRLDIDGETHDLSAGCAAGSWRSLGYVDQMRALFGEAPIRAGTGDGLAVMEIIAAAYWSAGLGRPVTLPFEGPLEATPWQLWRASGATPEAHPGPGGLAEE